MLRDHLTQRARVLRILTVASLDWRNGHEYALQAMCLLREQEVPFCYRIVGSGPFLEAVAFARHELQLDDRVELCQTTDMRSKQHFEWADLFVCAAVSDGASNGLAGALGAGLPIVCTDAPRLLQGLEVNGSCVIVPRRDSKALARVISGHVLAPVSISCALQA
jgi:glycosyltransferase involved in cell wall biosynthesis